MDHPDESKQLDRIRFQMRIQGKAPEQLPPLLSGIDTRGYLPHVKRDGAWYFVTFRLADSLPTSVLAKMEFELENTRHEVDGESRALTASERKKARQRIIERYLDMGAGACWLQRPEIAQMAAAALKHFNGIRYELDEWVIMPNHIHPVLLPLANHSLSSILQSRKRLIAREANKLIGKTGESFWQPESYDHWIRSDEEMTRIKEYIRQNPVKGKLCETADEWPWGSAWRNTGGGTQETID